MVYNLGRHLGVNQSLTMLNCVAVSLSWDDRIIGGAAPYSKIALDTFTGR